MRIVAGFMGYECEDIVLYLAKIWTLLGKKVVILDRTRRRNMFGICGLWSGKQETEEYEAIEITTESEKSSGAEILLKVFDELFIAEEAAECQEFYLITDETAFHAAQFSDIGLTERPYCLLVRNAIPLKYGEAYLKLISGQSIERCSFLPLDERDIRGRCLLATERGTPLRKLSGEMKELLCEIVLELDASVNKRSVLQVQRRG